MTFRLLLGLLCVAALSQPLWARIPPRKVSFRTDPPGARIYLEISGNRGGEFLGVSPGPVLIEQERFAGVGSLDVRFERDGYYPEVRNIKSLQLLTQDSFPERGTIRLEARNPLAEAVRSHPVGISVTLVVTLGLLALLHRARQTGREAEDSLSRVLEEFSEREAMIRRLMDELTAAKEHGRRELAHDLHDGLLQYLVAADLHLANFQEDLESDTDRRDLQRGIDRLHEAVAEGRRLIAHNTPAPLEVGLRAALEALIQPFVEDGMNVETSIHLVEEFDTDLELAVFRFTQEALNNVRKHAQAQRLALTVRVTREDRLVVRVRDWGRGFDPGAEHMGVGLVSMRARAEENGGIFSVQSSPGKGTEVEAWFPIQVRLEPTPAGY